MPSTASAPTPIRTHRVACIAQARSRRPGSSIHWRARRASFRHAHRTGEPLRAPRRRHAPRLPSPHRPRRRARAAAELRDRVRLGRRHGIAGERRTVRDRFLRRRRPRSCSSRSCSSRSRPISIGRVVAAFARSNFTTTEQALLNDIRNHEAIHRGFLEATLGAGAAFEVTPAFRGLPSPTAPRFSRFAKQIEDLGIAMYNGVAQYVASSAHDHPAREDRRGRRSPRLRHRRPDHAADRKLRADPRRQSVPTGEGRRRRAGESRREARLRESARHLPAGAERQWLTAQRALHASARRSLSRRTGRGARCAAAPAAGRVSPVGAVRARQAATGLVPATDARSTPCSPTKARSSCSDHQAITYAAALPAPSPTFDFTVKGAFPGFAFAAGQYATLQMLSQIVEDLGVRAYLGQLAALASDKSALNTALAIFTVKGRNASEVRRLRGKMGWITGNSRDDLPVFAAAGLRRRGERAAGDGERRDPSPAISASTPARRRRSTSRSRARRSTAILALFVA